jgi:hypothetical protein
LLPLLLLTWGLLAPTSIGGTILLPLVLLHFGAATALFLFLAWGRGYLGSGLQVWCAAAIVATVVGASVLSPFGETAPGAVVFYFGMAAMFMVDWRPLTPAAPLEGALAGVTGLVLVIGTAVVAGMPWANELLISLYSMSYPDLVVNMTGWHKPVFTFGSHSIAGFFYFLLFYLNAETYRLRGRGWAGVAAAALIALGVFLTSVTAAAFMALATGLLLLVPGRQRWVIGTAALAGVGVALVYFRPYLEGLALVAALTQGVTDQGAGLSGRYAAGGALLGNLDLIREQPFRPIGITYSPTLFYGDSGPIEYLTRGSFVLLILVYGTLAVFLIRGLQKKRHRVVLFAATVLFELGFTVLNYYRYQWFLPFAVLYLNHLEPEAPAEPPPGAL